MANGCHIAGTPIVVDIWSRREGKQRLHFLSHMHGDHTAGLSSSWNKTIYCSEITKTLAIHKFNIDPSLFVVLPYEQCTIINMDEKGDEKLSVTVFDANHCPGAIMFVFEGYFGRILYTADFRVTDEMLSNPQLISNINMLYLDNTYCNPVFDFKSKAEATKDILNIVKEHMEHDICFGLDSLGKEDLLYKCALVCSSTVMVDDFRYRATQALSPIVRSMFTTDPDASLLRVVNRILITQNVVEAWNNVAPTIAIVPTSRFVGNTFKPTKIANVFYVNYSDHCSFPELKKFVSVVQPQRIYPIVTKPFMVDKSNKPIAPNTIFEPFLSKEPINPIDIPKPVIDFMEKTIQVQTIGQKRKLSRFFGRYRKATGITFQSADITDDRDIDSTSSAEVGSSSKKTLVGNEIIPHSNDSNSSGTEVVRSSEKMNIQDDNDSWPVDTNSTPKEVVHSPGNKNVQNEDDTCQGDSNSSSIGVVFCTEKMNIKDENDAWPVDTNSTPTEVVHSPENKNVQNEDDTCQGDSNSSSIGVVFCTEKMNIKDENDAWPVDSNSTPKEVVHSPENKNVQNEDNTCQGDSNSSSIGVVFCTEKMNIKDENDAWPVDSNSTPEEVVHSPENKNVQNEDDICQGDSNSTNTKVVFCAENKNNEDEAYMNDVNSTPSEVVHSPEHINVQNEDTYPGDSNLSSTDIVCSSPKSTSIAVTCLPQKMSVDNEGDAVSPINSASSSPELARSSENINNQDEDNTSLNNSNPSTAETVFFAENKNNEDDVSLSDSNSMQMKDVCSPENMQSEDSSCQGDFNSPSTEVECSPKETHGGVEDNVRQFSPQPHNEHEMDEDDSVHVSTPVSHRDAYHHSDNSEGDTKTMVEQKRKTRKRKRKSVHTMFKEAYERLMKCKKMKLESGEQDIEVDEETRQEEEECVVVDKKKEAENDQRLINKFLQKLDDEIAEERRQNRRKARGKNDVDAELLTQANIAASKVTEMNVCDAVEEEMFQNLADNHGQRRTAVSPSQESGEESVIQMVGFRDGRSAVDFEETAVALDCFCSICCGIPCGSRDLQTDETMQDETPLTLAPAQKPMIKYVDRSAQTNVTIVSVEITSDGDESDRDIIPARHYEHRDIPGERCSPIHGLPMRQVENVVEPEFSESDESDYIPLIGGDGPTEVERQLYMSDEERVNEENRTRSEHEDSLTEQQEGRGTDERQEDAGNNGNEFVGEEMTTTEEHLLRINRDERATSEQQQEQGTNESEGRRIDESEGSRIDENEEDMENNENEFVGEEMNATEEHLLRINRDKRATGEQQQEQGTNESEGSMIDGSEGSRIDENEEDMENNENEFVGEEMNATEEHLLRINRDKRATVEQQKSRGIDESEEDMENNGTEFVDRAAVDQQMKESAGESKDEMDERTQEEINTTNDRGILIVDREMRASVEQRMNNSEEDSENETCVFEEMDTTTSFEHRGNQGESGGEENHGSASEGTNNTDKLFSTNDFEVKKDITRLEMNSSGETLEENVNEERICELNREGERQTNSSGQLVVIRQEDAGMSFDEKDFNENRERKKVKENLKENTNMLDKEGSPEMNVNEQGRTEIHKYRSAISKDDIDACMSGKPLRENTYMLDKESSPEQGRIRGKEGNPDTQQVDVDTDLRERDLKGNTNMLERESSRQKNTEKQYRVESDDSVIQHDDARNESFDEGRQMLDVSFAVTDDRRQTDAMDASLNESRVTLDEGFSETNRENSLLDYEEPLSKCETDSGKELEKRRVMLENECSPESETKEKRTMEYEEQERETDLGKELENAGETFLKEYSPEDDMEEKKEIGYEEPVGKQGIYLEKKRKKLEQESFQENDRKEKEQMEYEVWRSKDVNNGESNLRKEELEQSREMLENELLPRNNMEERKKTENEEPVERQEIEGKSQSEFDELERDDGKMDFEEVEQSEETLGKEYFPGQEMKEKGQMEVKQELDIGVILKNVNRNENIENAERGFQEIDSEEGRQTGREEEEDVEEELKKLICREEMHSIYEDDIHLMWDEDALVEQQELRGDIMGLGTFLGGSEGIGFGSVATIWQQDGVDTTKSVFGKTDKKDISGKTIDKSNTHRCCQEKDILGETGGRVNGNDASIWQQDDLEVEELGSSKGRLDLSERRQGKCMIEEYRGIRDTSIRQKDGVEIKRRGNNWEERRDVSGTSGSIHGIEDGVEMERREENSKERIDESKKQSDFRKDDVKMETTEGDGTVEKVRKGKSRKYKKIDRASFQVNNVEMGRKENNSEEQIRGNQESCQRRSATEKYENRDIGEEPTPRNEIEERSDNETSLELQECVEITHEVVKQTLFACHGIFPEQKVKEMEAEGERGEGTEINKRCAKITTAKQDHSDEIDPQRNTDKRNGKIEKNKQIEDDIDKRGTEKDEGNRIGAIYQKQRTDKDSEEQCNEQIGRKRGESHLGKDESYETKMIVPEEKMENKAEFGKCGNEQMKTEEVDTNERRFVINMKNEKSKKVQKVADGQRDEKCDEVEMEECVEKNESQIFGDDCSKNNNSPKNGSATRHDKDKCVICLSLPNSQCPFEFLFNVIHKKSNLDDKDFKTP